MSNYHCARCGRLVYYAVGAGQLLLSPCCCADLMCNPSKPAASPRIAVIGDLVSLEQLCEWRFTGEIRGYFK